MVAQGASTIKCRSIRICFGGVLADLLFRLVTHALTKASLLPAKVEDVHLRVGGVRVCEVPNRLDDETTAVLHHLAVVLLPTFVAAVRVLDFFVGVRIHGGFRPQALLADCFLGCVH